MAILDFFFPRRCAGCGRAGTYFCQNCQARAKLHFPQVCPVCEKPAVAGITHARCKTTWAPDGLAAIWAYQGAPRKLITKLKYKFVLEMAEDLAKAAVVLLKTWSPKDKFLVVPIPLHWTRRNWRGFNHAEELAKILAKKLDWKVENLLVRRKLTSSQVGLKLKERQANIRGAFALNPNYPLTPKRYSLIIFDDVWTTGATLREAAKVLKRAGAKGVWCLTLAR